MNSQKTVIQHLKKKKCWFLALTTPLSEKVLPYIHIWSYLGNCVFDLADVWLDVDHFGLMFDVCNFQLLICGVFGRILASLGVFQKLLAWLNFVGLISILLWHWIGLVALDFGSFGLSWPHFVCFRLGLGICSTFKFWILLTFLMEGCCVGN